MARHIDASLAADYRQSPDIILANYIMLELT